MVPIGSEVEPDKASESSHGIQTVQLSFRSEEGKPLVIKDEVAARAASSSNEPCPVATNINVVNSREGQHIRNLCEARGDLQHLTFWTVAEKEWEKLQRKFEDAVDSNQKEENSVNSELFQLVGFAVAFQGVLITGVSQSSTESNLTCTRIKWWVLGLSLFASVLTAFGVWEKLKIFGRLSEAIIRDKPNAQWEVYSPVPDQRNGSGEVAGSRTTNVLGIQYVGSLSDMYYRDLRKNLLLRGPANFDFNDVQAKREVLESKSTAGLRKIIEFFASCKTWDDLKKFLKENWPPSFSTMILICLVFFGAYSLASIQFILCS